MPHKVFKTIDKSVDTHKPTLLVVIGPTSSGKSEFAVKLAKKHNGEIISADSRQVYRGLNIGTGKVTGKWTRTSSNFPYPRGRTNADNDSLNVDVSSGSPPNRRPDEALAKLGIGGVRDGMNLDKIFIYKGVIHHCIDFVSPKRQYSVSDFKRDGEKAIRDILVRGKTPIICGGTGQFVDALVLDTHIPEVPPDLSFRKKMEKKTVSELFALLKQKDPARASSIDPHNPRRLIRALEIIHTTGKPIPPLSSSPLTRGDVPSAGQRGRTLTINKFPISDFRFSIYYLNPPREQLYKKIEKRLKERVQQGMLQEVSTLHQQGLSWKRLDDLGLEYRYVSRYLRTLPRPSLPGALMQRRGEVGIPSQKVKSRTSSPIIRNWNLEIRNFLASQSYTQLLREIKHYAKRQQTWFKKYSD